MKVKNEVARKFIENEGAKFQFSTASHAFYKKGHVVMCIPLNKDIDLAHLETIATQQLNIAWQADEFEKQKTTSKSNTTIKN